MPVLLELFLTFFKVGSLAFGGGWAIMALIEHEAVIAHPWLTPDQFSQVLYVSAFTPGPIAVSGPAIIGQKVAGVPGAIAAVLGIVIPSVVIPMMLFYLILRFGDKPGVKGIMKGLGPVAVAMIVYVAWSVGKVAFGKLDFLAIGIGVAALVAMFFKVNPIYVILGGGIIGFFAYR